MVALRLHPKTKPAPLTPKKRDGEVVPKARRSSRSPMPPYHADTPGVVRAAHPLQRGHADGRPPERRPAARTPTGKESGRVISSSRQSN